MFPYNLVILGPQGSGKGTQARFLSEKFKMPNLGAGELIRKKGQENTEEGKKIRALHDAGMLIPSKLTKKIIEYELKKVSQSQAVIFEGYPRTMDQVRDFEDILAKREIKDKRIIALEIKENSVFKRLFGRRICKGCEKNYYPPDSLSKKQCSECGGKLIKRPDDTKEKIKKRLDVYHNETKPVLQYFEERGELLLINGESRIEDVTKKIIEKLERQS